MYGIEEMSMLDERMHAQIGSFAEDYINDDGEIESPDFDPFEDPEGFESIGQSDSEDNTQPNVPPQVPPPNPPQFLQAIVPPQVPPPNPPQFPQAIVPPQNPFQVLPQNPPQPLLLFVPHNPSQHLRQSQPQLSQPVLPRQAPASAESGATEGTGSKGNVNRRVDESNTWEMTTGIQNGGSTATGSSPNENTNTSADVNVDPTTTATSTASSSSLSLQSLVMLTNITSQVGKGASSQALQTSDVVKENDV